MEDNKDQSGAADALDSQLSSDEPSERESLIACLGDDATTLSAANPDDEMAQTMREAAAMLVADGKALDSQPTEEPPESYNEREKHIWRVAQASILGARLYTAVVDQSQPQPARQSIGEDAQFQSLSADFKAQKGDSFKRLVSYIDSRASAAPVTAIVQDKEQVVAWYDPRNTNPGQSVTFKREERDKWPHIYRVALIPAPQQEGSEAGK